MTVGVHVGASLRHGASSPCGFSRLVVCSKASTMRISSFRTRASEDCAQAQSQQDDPDLKQKPGENHMSQQHSLFAKLGQRFNIAGIAFTARVILRDRQLLLSHVHVPDISWIDWKPLKEKGFMGVVFDKDNTLTAPYVDSIWPSLDDSLQECKEYFGDRIALLSNSAGLYQYDPSGLEAEALERALGVPVIRHGTKKPSGTAEDLKKHFGCDPSLLVMVGDRHLTDVVYGNKNGLLTISTEPLTLKGEPFVVRKVRKFEDVLVRWFKSGGLKPLSHPLYSTGFEFVKDPACW